jgi:hypothetical protein
MEGRGGRYMESGKKEGREDRKRREKERREG